MNEAGSMAARFDDYNCDPMSRPVKRANNLEDGAGPTRGLSPGSPIGGKFRPEGSKSISQRFLVASALAKGVSQLCRLPGAEDVTATRELLESSKVPSDTKNEITRITGCPPSGVTWSPQAPVAVKESGTLARFAAAVFGLATEPGSSAELVPSGTLLRRQSLPLFRAMAGAGVGCEFNGVEGGFSVVLRAVKPPADIFLEEPGSSQDVSSLLFALASHEGRCHLHVRGEVPSMPYVEMTTKVITSFGARVQLWNNSEGILISIEGPLTAPKNKIEIEPDASSAGTALVAACISGGELSIEGLGETSIQGDIRIIEHLKAFGCEAGIAADRMWAKGLPTQSADVDFSREPDLAPAVVALAASVALGSGGTSRLRGLRTLPGKESDRIRLMARGLQAIGLSAEAGADSLNVGPPRPGFDDYQPPVFLDPKGDHRMAFAFALFGLLREQVFVLDSDCVQKSWPQFWSDLASMGATVSEA